MSPELVKLKPQRITNGENQAFWQNVMIQCCNTEFYYLLHSFYDNEITIPFTFLSI